VFAGYVCLVFHVFKNHTNEKISIATRPSNIFIIIVIIITFNTLFHNRIQQETPSNLHYVLNTYSTTARERVSFKLCLLVYKTIHGLAPCYLNEMCIPVSTVPNLSALRSAARGD